MKKLLLVTVFIFLAFTVIAEIVEVEVAVKKNGKGYAPDITKEFTINFLWYGVMYSDDFKTCILIGEVKDKTKVTILTIQELKNKENDYKALKVHNNKKNLTPTPTATRTP